MPDAGLEQLRERFAEDILPQPATYEDEDTPYIETVPPPVQEEPAPEQDEPQTPPVHDPYERPAKPPKIPEKYAAPLLSEDFSGRTNMALLRIGATRIRNSTEYDDEEIRELLEKGVELELEATEEPQVLLFHTHATESFERYDNTVYDTRNTWRSTDNNLNMAAVGRAMAEPLEAAGIGFIHDTTQHDYPSYNGSYERSAETVKARLEETPSLRILLDLHRDAMPRDDDVIVKPVKLIDGKKAAQIMIIAGCDDGEMNMPNWPKNLRFAVALQNKIEEKYPGLMRPIYLCYRKYNMHLSDGSLLLEFGSNASTLEEAEYSAKLAGEALAELILEQQEQQGEENQE
jgi:stage II sporulation protein P